MTQPLHPLAAVTHPDPYPYYAALVRDRPMARDAELGLWVAASAGAVTAALTAPQLRVRPPKEPVPKALEDTPAGDLFKLLVRQNDGSRHSPMKLILSTALTALSGAGLVWSSAECAARLADDLGLSDGSMGLAEYPFRLPVAVIGGLLGIPHDAQPRLAELVAKLVRGFSPLSTPGQIAGAQFAVRDLLEVMGGILSHPDKAPRDGVWPALLRAAPSPGAFDPAVLLANGIGLLTQSYEATAGLIGNALLALGQDPDRAAALALDGEGLDSFVQEVARHDAPVQNTRRFAAERVEIAGTIVEPGDAVLVLLAAANRDPAANPDPHCFDPARREPRIFTFGLGAHACPGAALAVTIAAAGVREVLRRKMDLAAIAAMPRYHSSANTRVPLLGFSS